MHKYVLFIMILATYALSHAESPQKVYRITQEYYSNDWYKKQAELWKKEIDKNPQNAAAWESYYYANRYANFKEINSQEKQSRLAKIIQDMGEAIPNSYEYTLLKAWNDHNVDDVSGFEKAYQMNPERPDPLYSMITHHELAGDLQKVKELYQAVYDSKDAMTPLLDYNYNVLMSLEKNAILFTHGDNDTYPARMLQEVKNIRPDVTIINISMSIEEKYLNRKLSERDFSLDVKSLREKAGLASEPYNSATKKQNFLQILLKALNEKYPDSRLYFALTVYDAFKTPIKENLYLTGLAELYSPAPLDNLAYLRKNIERYFRLDDVREKWYAEEYVGKRLMSQLNLNYVPGFIKLAEHYQRAGEDYKAEKWADMATALASAAGNDELMQFIQSKGF